MQLKLKAKSKFIKRHKKYTIKEQRRWLYATASHLVLIIIICHHHHHHRGSYISVRNSKQVNSAFHPSWVYANRVLVTLFDGGYAGVSVYSLVTGGTGS